MKEESKKDNSQKVIYQIKKSEIILLIMDFLKQEHLFKTLITLEQETTLSLYSYNQEISFFRKLILDGQWTEAEEFFRPLKQKHTFNYKSALYEIRKQKFLEEVETEPENNNEVDNLVKQLKEIQKLCDQDEFNKLLQCLKTTPSISDQEEYKNWNAISGRLICFEKVRKLLSIVYPIRDNEINTNYDLLKNLLKSIVLLSSSNSETVPLGEVCKRFITEIESSVNENKSEVDVNFEDDLGRTKNENNLLKSTRNEMIISQSMQGSNMNELIENANEQTKTNNQKTTENVNTIMDYNYNTTTDNRTQVENVEDGNIDNYYKKFKYDVKSFTLKKIIPDSNIIRTSCFNPKGDYLAIGTNSKSVKLFNLKDIVSNFQKKIPITNNTSMNLVFEQKNHHLGSIYCIDWSVSGRLLASGSNDKTIKLMVIPDLDTTTTDDDILELPITGHKGTVRSVIFDPSSDLVLFSAGSSDSVIKIWDTENGETKGELYGHLGDVHSLKWSSDATLFASTSEDKTIRFWDLKTLKTINTLDGEKHSVMNDISILNKESGILVASGHSDGKISIWDFGSRKIIKEIKGSFAGLGIRSVEFSPDGKYLMSGSFDGKIKIFDVNNNFTLSMEMNHNDKVVSTKWHPFIPLISTTSSDKSCRVWLPEKY